jgi:hypothetical protein
VTLAGNIGPLMATPPNYSLPRDVRDTFTAGIVAYYADFDWALDIFQGSLLQRGLLIRPRAPGPPR